MALKVFLLTLCAALAVPAAGKAFLRSHGHASNATAFQLDIENALSEVRGCGGHIEQGRLREIEARLRPAWASLPKLDGERVQRPILRHLVHRYFRQSYSFIVRGFETSRPVGDEDPWSVEQALSERVPAQLEAALASKQDAEGFGLGDVVNLVAVIEELVHDQEVTLLDQAYEATGTPRDGRVSELDLAAALMEYMNLWTGRDPLPFWAEVEEFAHGQIHTFEYQRRMGKHAGDRFSMTYSIDDAREIVRSITRSFGNFFQPVCEELIQRPLEKQDKKQTGRLSLARFYKASTNFAESENYLRLAGILDESSGIPQVVIPNYVQGTSNCFINTAHYMVCCQNACEGIHGDIEKAVGSPEASPADLLALVKDLVEHSSWDGFRGIPQELVEQLGDIARAHKGKVPLHGRLFAQWLHFAFPRDCPFPHQAGKVLATGPAGFETPLASGDEIAMRVEEEALHDGDEAHWMSQWSSEEELMAPPPKKTYRGQYVALGGAALLLALGAISREDQKLAASRASRPLVLQSSKAHLV